MVDYRSILRLHSQGNSQREIARELFCSRHTISDLLIQAMAAGITSNHTHQNGKGGTCHGFIALDPAIFGDPEALNDIIFI